MFLKSYDLEVDATFTSFEFFSEGPNGQILKLIQFLPTEYNAIFNLAFGDRVKESGDFDDMSVSNNRDTEKILITIAHAVYIFTSKNSNLWIYATGSTSARNRLYRMGISKFLKALEEDFEILGEVDDVWELFNPDRNYSAFLFKRKLILLKDETEKTNLR